MNNLTKQVISQITSDIHNLDQEALEELIDLIDNKEILINYISERRKVEYEIDEARKFYNSSNKTPSDTEEFNRVFMKLNTKLRGMSYER